MQIRRTVIVAASMAVLGPAAVVFLAPVARAQAHLLVSRVAVAAKPATYTGPCPTTVEFSATVFASKIPLEIDYRWERSDGGIGVKQHIAMEDHTLVVTDTWNLGKRGDRVAAWEKLHVLTPNEMSSPPGHVVLACQ